MTTTAYHTTTAQSRLGDALRGVARYFGLLLLAITSIPRARSMAAEFESLSRLSDQALAERGLAREGLAWHVFTRHFPEI